MEVTRQRVVTVVGFILSSLLLIFAASCSFQNRTTDDSGTKQTKENLDGRETKKKTFVANQFCSACHYAFADEELARNHASAGIGCERCHGESERHRSDEDNVTPPEIMYPKAKIIPTCMMCHPRHEISHVKHHERLLAGAKTVFDSDSKNAGSQITCTTCHAKQHRINVRTIRWNKATGELLDE
ncbi:MAG: multiheme c-type cytochrome [Planctomycetota bacterium]